MIVVLFLTVLTVHQVNCEVCSSGNAGKGCYTTEDWRQNILCRIQGGVDATTGQRRNDGYLSNTVLGQYSSEAERLIKQLAAVSSLTINY